MLCSLSLIAARCTGSSKLAHVCKSAIQSQCSVGLSASLTLSLEGIPHSQSAQDISHRACWSESVLSAAGGRAELLLDSESNQRTHREEKQTEILLHTSSSMR